MARGESEEVGNIKGQLSQLARAELAEEKNDGEWKIAAAGKGKNRSNPMYVPADLAAEAAKIGYPMSPNAAIAA